MAFGFFRHVGSRLQKKPAETYSGELVYAIGDMHGMLDQFIALMKAIQEHQRQFADNILSLRIIVLGDFIDRGPHSARLTQLLMDAERRSTGLEILLGNHEAMLLDVLDGKDGAVNQWLKSGGYTTLQSFGVKPPEEGECLEGFGRRLARAIGTETCDWLRGLPLSTVSGRYFFCHAGVRPGVPLADQESKDLLWIRRKFTRSTIDHGAIIVHGHSVVKSVEIMDNRIAVDTGAYRTGVLSAVALYNDLHWTLSTPGAPATPPKSMRQTAGAL